MKKREKNIIAYRSDDDAKITEDGSIQDTPEYNDYYLTVSMRFRTAKIICVFALCIFILSSMLIFGESLTYENARYIVRDLGQILSEDSDEPAPQINVDIDGDTDYTVFRGSIVVCGVSGVEIFSPSGTLKLSDNTSFISPTAAASDKYCVVYSLGSYNLSVYNAVARVYDMKFDYPIYDVAVSDDGHIAIMTQNSEYKCVVYLYDSDFRQIATYNKVLYPCAVAFSADSKDLYIATFGTAEGKYSTKLEGYTLDSEVPICSVTVAGAMPYDVSPTSDKTVALLTADSLVYYSREGNQIADISLSGGVSAYHSTDSSFSLLIDDGTVRSVSYDNYGELIHTYEANDAIDIHRTDSALLIRYKSSVRVYPDSGAEAYSLELVHGVKEMFSNDGYLYVCRDNTITSISLE